jgi:EAL domain-containing protein (putative c-di-GMP-specific phosphodiesterase class I)
MREQSDRANDLHLKIETNGPRRSAPISFGTTGARAGFMSADLSSRSDHSHLPAPTPRVLLAEDDPVLLRSYARLLRRAGYQVEAVTEGRAAAAHAASTSFDVILTDLGLPDLDGIELLRRVRERDREVPVVIITGAPATSTAIQAVEYGALHYLLKPCGDSQLQEVVAEAVRVGQVARLRNAALASLAQGHAHADASEACVDRAIDSLWIAYQPIVRWSTRQTFAYEALLRTREPTLACPTALIDAANRLGRLHQVARLVRARVAADLPSAPSEQLFVNVHPQDLLDEHLYDPAAPLSRHAGRVVLELTERASLSEIPDVATRIASLRALGYRIAIDDLGAGYSALNYFAELQPDVAKIDMSLVRDVHRQPCKRVVIEAIHAACEALDILVIAEGVETIEEREALVNGGCDLLQGYLFATPQPPFPAPRWPEDGAQETILSP